MLHFCIPILFCLKNRILRSQKTLYKRYELTLICFHFLFGLNLNKEKIWLHLSLCIGKLSFLFLNELQEHRPRNTINLWIALRRNYWLYWPWLFSCHSLIPGGSLVIKIHCWNQQYVQQKGCCTYCTLLVGTWMLIVKLSAQFTEQNYQLWITWMFTQRFLPAAFNSQITTLTHQNQSITLQELL